MTSDNPHIRQAACIWLLAVVKKCGKHQAVQEKLKDVQAAFMSLLSEKDGELEAASEVQTSSTIICNTVNHSRHVSLSWYDNFANFAFYLKSYICLFEICWRVTLPWLKFIMTNTFQTPIVSHPQCGVKNIVFNCDYTNEFCMFMCIISRWLDNMNVIPSRSLIVPNVWLCFITELIQDIASKGLGVVYENCTKEQKDEMVAELVQTLMTGKRWDIY